MSKNMPKAKPSTRVLNDVDLSCGLVNIPLSIYNGNDDQYKGFERHLWLPVETGKGKKKVVDFHPVGNLSYDKETGKPLTFEEKDQVVSLVDTEYGKVYVDDQEVYKALNLDPNTLMVLSFQPLALLNQGHHYVPKKLMFVEPRKVKHGSKKVAGKNATNALAALLQGMRSKGVFAVCELTTRDLPKPCILLPDGSLIQVWHTNALREQREIPEVEVPESTQKALDVLIDSYLETEPADLEDKKSALILGFATEKAENGDFSVPDADTTKEPEATDLGDDDFTAALMKSIEAAKSGKKAKAS